MTISIFDQEKILKKFNSVIVATIIIRLYIVSYNSYTYIYLQVYYYTISSNLYFLLLIMYTANRGMLDTRKRLPAK